MYALQNKDFIFLNKIKQNKTKHKTKYIFLSLKKTITILNCSPVGHILPLFVLILILSNYFMSLRSLFQYFNINSFFPPYQVNLSLMTEIHEHPQLPPLNGTIWCIIHALKHDKLYMEMYEQHKTTFKQIRSMILWSILNLIGFFSLSLSSCSMKCSCGLRVEWSRAQTITDDHIESCAVLEETSWLHEPRGWKRKRQTQGGKENERDGDKKNLFMCFVT